MVKASGVRALHPLYLSVSSDGKASVAANVSLVIHKPDVKNALVQSA